MRATTFHAVTWDRRTRRISRAAREGPPSLILQSKFAVEQSRVYTRPGQDIGHYGPSYAFVFYKTYSPYVVPSCRPSRHWLPLFICQILIASAFYARQERPVRKKSKTRSRRVRERSSRKKARWILRSQMGLVTLLIHLSNGHGQQMTMDDMTKHAFVKISRENTIEVKLLKKIVFCKRY